MESKDTTQLFGLLHDAAARLEDYLEHDAAAAPIKEMLKDELLRVLEDIQVFTLHYATSQKEE